VGDGLADLGLAQEALEEPLGLHQVGVDDLDRNDGPGFEPGDRAGDPRAVDTPHPT